MTRSPIFVTIALRMTSMSIMRHFIKTQRVPCPGSGRWVPDVDPSGRVRCEVCGCDDVGTVDRWPDRVKTEPGRLVMDHSRELDPGDNQGALPW